MKSALWDWLAMLGSGLVVAGVAMIHWPSAMIFGGAALAILGLWGAWRETRLRGPAMPEEEAETNNPQG